MLTVHTILFTDKERSISMHMMLFRSPTPIVALAAMVGFSLLASGSTLAAGQQVDLPWF